MAEVAERVLKLELEVSLLPDAHTRCSQARCEYQPGLPKLWKKPAIEKGRLVRT